MQMNSVQSCTEKRTVCGHAPGYGGLLTADCHPNEINFAKQILLALAQAYETSWHVEFQDDRLAFWCGLHETYGYRMGWHDVGKGMHVVKKRGQELVERIKAGCLHSL